MFGEMEISDLHLDVFWFVLMAYLGDRPYFFQGAFENGWWFICPPHSHVAPSDASLPSSCPVALPP